MINTIIEAISTALDKTFGEGYEIYMEEIKQGLQEPCFFIQCLHPTTSLFLGKRYFKENPFCIQYFPLTEMETPMEQIESQIGAKEGKEIENEKNY